MVLSTDDRDIVCPELCLHNRIMTQFDSNFINPRPTEARVPPHGGGDVSDWVARCACLIRPGGRVLDHACGSGRHARWLAQQGYQVDAVDRDPVALSSVTGVPGIHARQVNLESGDWPYESSSFDGIVVTNYLFRPRLELLLQALAPGGVLIYETFMQGNERFGKPSNPDFLLQPGELLVRVAGLHVVAFEQGVVSVPRPAVVQRICAARTQAITEVPLP